MKIILILVGLALLACAGMYFTMPADSLPSFFPGHEAGLARMHYKHGAVAAVIGAVLLGLGFRR